ncbi:NAD(P)/FAD-dependent oxidoreductase [Halobacillus karajensis]|uniref:Thioredoxin reductase n=1 Tax=Halobacillus karajensis TaxID=195088 RepID=A0A024P5C5_9BACI|nr:NAD(P)/FAD-dependent oxidoreductase [Halobacillus karajensis]CDQ17813.1 Thioredoxin reductase [Halobacillus karajensis]CDQ24219.1 Thioredoxin reductase [Halobacillus karajensis]CDQ29532.1 Thioredoxin reductase [Halobacillus karajensis]
MAYDCIIIGGGIAGLQAGIMLGRYKRSVLIIDSGHGRSSLCKRYNNIIGFPEGVSGDELRLKGWKQAKTFGAEFLQSEVIDIHNRFHVKTKCGRTFKASTLLFATGLEERLPDIAGIKECLGLSVYVCPDCDGYEIVDKKTVVVGSGDTGAHMSLTLKYWNDEITFLNHGGKELSLEMQGRLRKEKITVQQVIAERFVHSEGCLQKIITRSGLEIEADHSFLAFGGNRVQSDLAVQLGAHHNEKGHLLVDPRTRMTNVDGVWASGDIVDHSQFVTTAMGDGAQAAVWIHKWLKGEG